MVNSHDASVGGNSNHDHDDSTVIKPFNMETSLASGLGLGNNLEPLLVNPMNRSRSNAEYKSLLTDADVTLESNHASDSTLLRSNSGQYPAFLVEDDSNESNASDNVYLFPDDHTPRPSVNSNSNSSIKTRAKKK